MKITFFIIFTFMGLWLAAQDTLQLMQYNLLNYGNYWNDCTTNTNNVNDKNVYLKTIINYVDPDIFTVNELSENTSYHHMILNQVLNTNGVSKYRKALSFNYADSYLVNMLYYNSEKLTLYSQNVVHSIVRDIDIYTLYYNSGDLAQTQDTIFLSCFVAHLKAGTGSTNEDKRASMVSSAMSYIRTHDLPENMLFMGDFNVYDDDEQAYKNLIYSYNGIQYFFDPIEREGHWNNNSSFKDVHTQSTHSINTACFSHGGMDDRFDFIMASSSLLQSSNNLHLLINTYKALGNDGQHFNKSINDSPNNSSAPSQIIDALFSMSDHLPILTQLRVDASLGIHEDLSIISAIHFPNPCSEVMQLQLQLKKAQTLEISIFNLYGKQVYNAIEKANTLVFEKSILLEHLPNGLYVIRFTDEQALSRSKKFILIK